MSFESLESKDSELPKRARLPFVLLSVHSCVGYALCINALVVYFAPSLSPDTRRPRNKTNSQSFFNVIAS